MNDPVEHIENLVRHIRLVQDAALLIGKKFLEKSNTHIEFGRNIIARAFCHDNSKFYGIEWDYLHSGKNVPKTALKLSIRQHQLSNDHHPEFWGDIHEMSDIAICEMVIDWYARSQEFGTSFREWIDEEAGIRYKFSKESIVYKKIMEYVDMLVGEPFTKV